MHDAALDAANRLLWPLIPRGDATGLASALDAIAADRQFDATTTREEPADA